MKWAHVKQLKPKSIYNHEDGQGGFLPEKDNERELRKKDQLMEATQLDEQSSIYE